MSLQQRDKKHLWHPLTQHKLHPDTLAIKKAKGVWLYDEHEKAYIDGIASWYTCMYGHCNDYILEKVYAQLQVLDHVVFTGFTHQPAVELSEALIDILPDNQQKIFFSDNGSTAVDVALKMALQFYFNQDKKKTRIIAFEDGFHGDTFGAMSVSGLSVYNGPFEEFFINVERLAVPDENNIESVKSQLTSWLEAGDVAAFIYEPLVQGAAAMKMHEAKYLDQLLQLTQQYDVLNIADEVMTGFGKTGTDFASQQLQTLPDIICLSKALTAGVSPMAITSCSQKVYDAFYDDAITRGFFHGHTYSANPLGCTAALAGIELLKSEAMQLNIKRIEASHQEFADYIKGHPKVASTRHLGVIFALELAGEMDRYGSLRDQFFQFFMDAGVFLRPLGNVIYILPPYVINDTELERIYETIEKALDELDF